ncbi:MAG TPA: PVC-type heme-binding CxxCH protein [Tepidisphaeraceae bacterium]|jgi:putative membrane-bound dehydrogenase-like protein|nr:PVC-type heme-binding CxxCH protein [Tepidisphaeraceae bacterium]
MRLALPLAACIFLPAIALAQGGPIPPAQAPQHMTLPPGFHATLFAGEPDVVQPIAFAFDDRGRIWVAECNSYPQWEKDPTKAGHDRILIFEDDGSGHFSKRKIFLDNLVNLSGLEIGFGGVWVLSAPKLLFIPFAKGDDTRAGEPQAMLDGWTLEAKHNIVNRLTWGPDGWLWGCHGILATSNVGLPGAPDARRTKINCGVWRYHPTRHTFEVVASGTTNPWGLDFDDYGEAFITNCVISHLWHVIPGAHYQRMFGEDLDKDAYGLMSGCADHIHWAGGDWTTSRTGDSHSQAGGGHAHAGCMVYLGDNWPDSFRSTVSMCNIHGNRVNNDLLERKGSGYVAHHGHDLLLANDPWFRGLNLAYGPDGGVYLSDWTDTGECHNYSAVDRTNGRIYKITYGTPAAVSADVSGRSDDELVALQWHKNDWWVRHARRVLQERAAAGTLGTSARPALLKALKENPDVTRQLRALWALHATGGVGESLTFELLGSPQETVRAWAIRLALEDHNASDALLDRLAALAKEDRSPVVRLALASGLQRLPLQQRWSIAEALVAHGEDAADQNLPLMIWYGIEPLVPADQSRASGLVLKAKIPLIREYVARRLATTGG